MSVDSSWTHVASVDDVQPGEGFECDVEIDGKIIGLFNLDGEYFALGECPHEEGPLGQGRIEENEVVCPWHSAKFDIRTGKCTMPPSACRTNGTMSIAGLSEEEDAEEAVDCQSFVVKVMDSKIYVKAANS